MSVKFESKINPQTTRKITDAHLKKYWWVFALISLAFIVFGLIGIFLGEDGEDVSTGIFIVICGILISPIAILVIRIRQKRLDKTSAYIREETYQAITFYRDKFTIESTTGNAGSETLNQSSSVSQYGIVHRVVEQQEYYLVYISSMQYYSVFKSDLTEGTLEELNDIFKEKIGSRFYQAKKK